VTRKSDTDQRHLKAHHAASPSGSPLYEGEGDLTALTTRGHKEDPKSSLVLPTIVRGNGPYIPSTIFIQWVDRRSLLCRTSFTLAE
jgi:hypothetical protein